MAEYVEPFTLYPRKMKDGRRVWYYRARDAEGKRLGGISTGKLSKAEAYSHCNALLKAGALIPAPKESAPPKPVAEVRRSRRPPTLAEWAAERHWWEWDENKPPACLYCKGELARSLPESPAIQRGHADDCARILKDHIAPDLGAYRLDHVTPAMCEALMASWADAGASPKTINNRASVARVMFSEAARLRVIPSSPWAEVKGYRASKARRGILTLDEYKALMSPASRAATWSRDEYYGLNLLASVTGLRLGECLDLKVSDLHEDHITVSGSWDIKYGEGPQKTKRGTDNLPIPRYVYDVLSSLASSAFGGYLFSLGDGKRPCTGNRVNDALTKALEKIGITNSIRTERKLSFHGWRAFANTYFRSMGVPDAKVREITRHESEEMTEHYSAWRLEDFREVSAAQSELVKLLSVE